MWDDLHDSKGLKVLFACSNRHIKVCCRRSTRDNLYDGNGLKVLFACFSRHIKGKLPTHHVG